MMTQRGFGAAARAALLLVLGVATARCVKEPDAVTCPTGIYCPAGSQCAARQEACIFDGCGNGVVEPGELCDDGNIEDGDGCSHDCQSNEGCGNTHIDPGEVCDEGVTYDTTTCSHNCKSTGICGDTYLNVGEQCDPGVIGTDTSTCTKDCTLSRCGDGYVNAVAGEACDDGNPSDSDTCVDCQWAYCGDGFVNAVGTTTVHGGISSPKEQCDLGAANGDDANCPYGTLTCAPCSTTCTKLTPVTHYCGNGTPGELTNLGYTEQCDNLHSFVCGTCDPTSCTTIAVAAATGMIEVLATTAIVDGDSFTLDDGVVPLPWRFELDVDGVCTPANNPAQKVACVDLAGSVDPAGVASAIRAEINKLRNTALTIEAAQGATASQTRLRNTIEGVTRNAPIETSGSSFFDPGGAITVHGMGGGAGCATGSACRFDSDCVNGDCRRGSCN